MGKHSYDAFTEVSDIMRCTRIYPFGIGAAVEITITRGVHSDNNVFATGMVPSRPTGAHRQSDNIWADANAVILVIDQFGRYIECPREFVYDDIAHMPVAVGFEYIRI